MTHSVAYREGYDAYERGDVEIWQNAYNDPSHEADDWREGWLAGAAAHEREADMAAEDRRLDDPRHTPRT